MNDHRSQPPSPSELRGLRELLLQWTGIALSENKQHLVENRLNRRLTELGIDRYAEYLRRLKDEGPHGDESRRFINSLTTNKTAFFREPRHFEFVKDQVVKWAKLRTAAGHPRRLRLWCAATSTGEEPYTLAMVLRESLPSVEGWDVRILATDLDTDVLAVAGRGIYDQERLDEIPAALRARNFRPSGMPGKSCVDRELARMITFAQANLVAEPFPVRGRFDVIFCRNVMIYFERTTQIKLVDNLLKQLGPGGHLIVGHSESLIGLPLPIETVEVGVYRPSRTALRASPAPTTASPAPVAAGAARTAPAPARIVAGRRPALPSRSGHRSASAITRPLLSPLSASALARERIVLGQWYASKTPVLVSTVLGSCVAACLFDPALRIGGMNHFMLPCGDADSERPARFGVHAMEVLVNDMMKLGADRSRIVAKVFGAAAVTKALSPKVSVGNATFIRDFLARERIPLLAERLGGTRPHEVTFNTETGQAFHKLIAQQDESLVKRESDAWSSGQPEKPAAEAAPPSFELF